MSEHIVKDVGFGRVFKRIAAPLPRRGWKESCGEHLKKRGSGKKAADWRRTPTGARRKAGADRGEVGKPIFLESDDLKAIKVFACRMLFALGQDAADKL